MGKYSVEYLPIAIDDLEDIFNYIAEDDPSSASAFLNEIDVAILHMEEFSEMGLIPKVRRLMNKGYRMLIINEYLVFYVLIGNIVEIRRIISSKRNYASLLF